MRAFGLFSIQTEIEPLFHRSVRDRNDGLYRLRSDSGCRSLKICRVFPVQGFFPVPQVRFERNLRCGANVERPRERTSGQTRRIAGSEPGFGFPPVRERSEIRYAEARHARLDGERELGYFSFVFDSRRLVSAHRNDGGNPDERNGNDGHRENDFDESESAQARAFSEHTRSLRWNRRFFPISNGRLR